jgi:hypothetical protein
VDNFKLINVIFHVFKFAGLYKEIRSNQGCMVLSGRLVMPMLKVTIEANNESIFQLWVGSVTSSKIATEACWAAIVCQ